MRIGRYDVRMHPMIPVVANERYRQCALGGGLAHDQTMTHVSAVGRSVAAALRPGPNPWAVPAALRAAGSAGLIALTGAALGDLQAVGLA